MIRETDPGENQFEIWTTEQEQTVWLLFIICRPGEAKWTQMAGAVGKSVKACKRKVEKIYKKEGEECLWQHHLHVHLQSNRNDLPWTETDNNVLKYGKEAGMDMLRVGELLGRTPEACDKQLSWILHAGVEPFFPELE